MEERERVPLALFPPFSFQLLFLCLLRLSKKKRSKTKKERKNTRETKREERVVASIKKKNQTRALSLFFFTHQHGSHALGFALLRRFLVVWFRDYQWYEWYECVTWLLVFLLFLSRRFFSERTKDKQREKKKVGRRQKKETKSRVAMATIRLSFAKRHSESTLCRSFPVHPLLLPLLFFPLLVFV